MTESATSVAESIELTPYKSSTKRVFKLDPYGILYEYLIINDKIRSKINQINTALKLAKSSQIYRDMKSEHDSSYVIGPDSTFNERVFNFPSNSDLFGTKVTAEVKNYIYYEPIMFVSAPYNAMSRIDPNSINLKASINVDRYVTDLDFDDSIVRERLSIAIIRKVIKYIK